MTHLLSRSARRSSAASSAMPPCRCTSSRSLGSTAGGISVMPVQHSPRPGQSTVCRYISSVDISGISRSISSSLTGMHLYFLGSYSSNRCPGTGAVGMIPNSCFAISVSPLLSVFAPASRRYSGRRPFRLRRNRRAPPAETVRRTVWPAARPSPQPPASAGACVTPGFLPPAAAFFAPSSRASPRPPPHGTPGNGSPAPGAPAHAP